MLSRGTLPIKSACTKRLATLSVIQSRTAKSWAPKDSDEMERMVTTAIQAQLESAHAKATAQVVPWFLRHMPSAYFNSTHESARMVHLRAIAAFKDAGIAPQLTIKNAADREITVIRGDTGVEQGVGKKPGLLSEMMSELPSSVSADSEFYLSRVKVFTASDNTLALNTFKFGKQVMFDETDPDNQKARDAILEYCTELNAGKYLDSDQHCKPNPMFEAESMLEYLKKCTAPYVQRSNVRRLVRQREMYNEVVDKDAVSICIENDWAEGTMVTVAAANALPKYAMQKVLRYLAICKLDIRRLHLDVVDEAVTAGKLDIATDTDKKPVTMMRMLVNDDEREGIDWTQMSKDLKRLKWLDNGATELTVKMLELKGVDLCEPKAEGTKDEDIMLLAEVTYAIGQMMHGVLAKKNQYAFTRSRIHEILGGSRGLPYTVRAAELFLAKFNPNGPHMSEDEIQKEASLIRAEIQKNIEDESSVTALNCMVDAVIACKRTNAFCEDRFALGLRMDPSFMGVNEIIGEDIPFGTFFVHGRRFNGFHVRFRDISRGGLRVVVPGSEEQHAFESSRQYAEAYSLAFAQQLKNKDIPEGGSKAVVLIEPNDDTHDVADPVSRSYLIRRCIKAFSDTILDLVTPDPAVKERIVDHLHHDELIYLGPDENVAPEHINWMVERAALRGYPIPSAFISSKPDAGINHKVYGVTSEGVAVFTDVALQAIGKNPHEEPFTVKITGGTDGDVAGNIVKFLHRDYGDNVRVVGMADGTAVVEDPEGLDMDELIRMLEEELPLSEYSKAHTLSAKGLFKVIGGTDDVEALRLRNTMHNRVEADVFIPAGGRPATINESNWQQYLKPDGTPSSPLVVEGANLFITPQARKALFDAGTLIVKDSSANKCGVICSSYEIIASMMLDHTEFMDVKEELVSDVVTKLRELARIEAELMFREWNKNPSTPLPETSQRISHCVTRVHDAVSTVLHDQNDLPRHPDSPKGGDARATMLFRMVEEHLPAKLRESIGRVEERVPIEYVRQVVSSSLASKIVYKEGLDYVDSLATEQLGDLALRYLQQELRVRDLAAEVEALQAKGELDVRTSEEIIDLLSRGGVRAAIDKL